MIHITPEQVKNLPKATPLPEGDYQVRQGIKFFVPKGAEKNPALWRPDIDSILQKFPEKDYPGITQLLHQLKTTRYQKITKSALVSALSPNAGQDLTVGDGSKFLQFIRPVF